MLVGAYGHIDHAVHDALRKADDGAPEHWVNSEAFRFVKENTPPTARIAAYHPLITGLYADRKCMRWRYTWDSKEIWEEFMRFEVDYLLYNSQLGASDTSLHQLIRERPGAIREVWQNSRNILYEIKRDNQ